MQGLQSIPSPGIRKLNGVGGAGVDVDLISTDGTITFAPDELNKTIDLSASAGAGGDFVIKDVPCDESVYLGAIVRIDALGVAWNALADTFENSHAIGIVEYKETTTTCDIRLEGMTSIIFVALNPTKDYYLSSTVAGAISTDIPTSSGMVMIKVGQPLAATRFAVKIDQRIRRN